MTRYALFFNPSSGDARGAELARALHAGLAAKGHAIELVETDLPGACWSAIDPARCDVAIVQGGDGTLNAALQAQRAAGLPIAFFGRGTVNVASWELGLPREPDAFAAALEDGRALSVPLSRADARAWLLFAEIGYQAAGVRLANEAVIPRKGFWPRRWRKTATFVRAFARALCAKHPWFTVGLEGEPAPRRATSLLIYRTRCYGGFMRLPLDVHVEDPAFGVLGLALESGPARILVLLLAALRLARPAVAWLERRGLAFSLRSTRVRLAFEPGALPAAHLDAESLATPPAEIALEAERLTLLVGPARAGGARPAPGCAGPAGGCA